MQAKIVEKFGLKKSSFIALTVRFHMYLMSGTGRLEAAIFGDDFQSSSEHAYISHARAYGRPSC